MKINNEDHTILLVDDEENILRSLRRVLIGDDYNLLTASSGTKGLELLDDNEVSLIISDQKMPEMTGTEFLARAREKAPDTVRIMLTGYSDINSTVDAINRGEVYKYITKPWDDDQLRLTVKEAIERYSLIEENKKLTELTMKQNEELKEWNNKLEQRVKEQTMDIQKRNKELVNLNEKLKKNFQSSLEAFSNLIELREPTVGSHSKNVAELSIRTAKVMGLPEKEIDTIGAAALLHDIGKIGISDDVLDKNGENITIKEREQIEQHSIRGQATVEPIEDLRESGILIRHHHEWYKGHGYPDGLAGTEIPLGSRIIALADAFERLSNPGPQGGKFNVQNALSIIKGSLNSKFDPEIFGIMKKIADGVFQNVSQNIGADVDIYLPRDLEPGMVVSQDVRSGTGLLIIPGGSELTLGKITSLRRIYEVDPSKTGIHITKKK